MESNVSNRFKAERFCKISTSLDSCLGPPDECLQIAVALLQVILWLVKSIYLSLEKISENGSNLILNNLLQMSELLYGICAQDQTRMLLYVARLEDEGMTLSAIPSSSLNCLSQIFLKPGIDLCRGVTDLTWS